MLFIAFSVHGRSKGLMLDRHWLK